MALQCTQQPEEIMMSTTESNQKGQFTLEHFHLLLAGTSIKGDEVKLALREHLVYGTQKKVACQMHGANFSQFSSRLGTLHNEHDRAARMAKFYVPAWMLNLPSFEQVSHA